MISTIIACAVSCVCNWCPGIPQHRARLFVIVVEKDLADVYEKALDSGLPKAVKSLTLEDCVLDDKTVVVVLMFDESIDTLSLSFVDWPCERNS